MSAELFLATIWLYNISWQKIRYYLNLCALKPYVQDKQWK